MEEAQERKSKRAAIAHAEKIDERLAHFGKVTNIDFGKFDLDKPLPDSRHDQRPSGRTSSSSARWPTAARSARPWRASTPSTCRSSSSARPTPVAARMGEVMQEVGGDGYLFSMPNVNRRTLAEIEDGLVPALQDRGLMRTAYEHKQFRDNLLAF